MGTGAEAREDVDTGFSCASVSASTDIPGQVTVLLEADYSHATVEGARAYAAAILRIADAVEKG